MNQVFPSCLPPDNQPLPCLAAPVARQAGSNCLADDIELRINAAGRPDLDRRFVLGNFSRFSSRPVVRGCRIVTPAGVVHFVVRVRSGQIWAYCGVADEYLLPVRCCEVAVLA